MVKRIVAGSTLALALLAAACGGGASEPQQPVPATSSSNAISEADAVAAAEAVAVEQGLSVDGLTVVPSEIFGEWQVSFEPPGETLEGGFLVVLKADTGELIDLVEYR